jgi:hypothetical protein
MLRINAYDRIFREQNTVRIKDTTNDAPGKTCIKDKTNDAPGTKSDSFAGVERVSE